jgi:hypothetical protein
LAGFDTETRPTVVHQFRFISHEELLLTRRPVLCQAFGRANLFNCIDSKN